MMGAQMRGVADPHLTEQATRQTEDFLESAGLSKDMVAAASRRSMRSALGIEAGTSRRSGMASASRVRGGGIMGGEGRGWGG